MRRLACLGLGAAVSLATLTSRAELPNLSKLSRRPAPTPVQIQVKSSTSELDLSALPKVAFDPLPLRTLPESFPPAPAELTLEEIAPPTPRAPSGKAGIKKNSTTTPRRLKMAIPGVFGAGNTPQADSHSAAMMLACSSGKATPRPVYWEALFPTTTGARLVRAQAWFDPAGCRLGEASRTEITLRTVAQLDGKPLLYGARVEEGLLIVAPWTQFNPAQAGLEQIGSMPLYQRGPISLLQMKVARGGAVVFAGGLFRHTLVEWWRGLGADTTATEFDPSTPMQVRLDLSQSASEETPLALLTLQRPVGRTNPPAQQPLKPSLATLRNNRLIKL